MRGFHPVADLAIKAAAERVVADLALARRQARNTSTSIEVVFVPGQDRYVLKKIRDLDRSSAEYTVILSAEPYNATLTSADFGGSARVIFNGYGMPDSEGQLVLGARGESRVVYLDPDTGKASVQ